MLTKSYHDRVEREAREMDNDQLVKHIATYVEGCARPDCFVCTRNKAIIAEVKRRLDNGRSGS